MSIIRRSSSQATEVCISGSILTNAEFATVAIAHNMKMVSVMEAGSKEVGDFAIWQNLRLF